jgi:hypothetical protein
MPMVTGKKVTANGCPEKPVNELFSLAAEAQRASAFFVPF